MAHKVSTIFAVHRVPPAQAPYLKADLQESFAPFCNDPKAPLKILAVDESTRNLVQTHDVKALGMSNGLAAACVFAWNYHYNLELSPDVIWIAIAQASQRWLFCLSLLHCCRMQSCSNA